MDRGADIGGARDEARGDGHQAAGFAGRVALHAVAVDDAHGGRARGAEEGAGGRFGAVHPFAEADGEPRGVVGVAVAVGAAVVAGDPVEPVPGRHTGGQREDLADIRVGNGAEELVEVCIRLVGAIEDHRADRGGRGIGEDPGRAREDPDAVVGMFMLEPLVGGLVIAPAAVGLEVAVGGGDGAQRSGRRGGPHRQHGVVHDVTVFAVAGMEEIVDVDGHEDLLADVLGQRGPTRGDGEQRITLVADAVLEPVSARQAGGHRAGRAEKGPVSEVDRLAVRRHSRTERHRDPAGGGSLGLEPVPGPGID